MKHLVFQVRCISNAGKCCPEHDLPSPVISQSADQIAELCRGLNGTHANSMEAPTESHDPPPRPLARHLSDADRLRKVIQELVDTEKSYVKVMGSGGHAHPFVDDDVKLAGRCLRLPLPGTSATQDVDVCSLR